jgi:hypothetical protein
MRSYSRGVEQARAADPHNIPPSPESLTHGTYKSTTVRQVQLWCEASRLYRKHAALSASRAEGTSTKKCGAWRHNLVMSSEARECKRHACTCFIKRFIRHAEPSDTRSIKKKVWSNGALLAAFLQVA